MIDSGHGFESDLKIGEGFQQEVLDKLITPRYPFAYIIEGHCKEGDIYIPETNGLVEVKGDFKSFETGNIVIEISMNGKLSGLSTTKSYRWIFVTPDKYILTSPRRIRCLLRNFSPCSFVGKGDRKSKNAYLLSESVVISNCLKVYSRYAD